MTLSTIEPYQPQHSAECLAIFDSNVPTYFAPIERAEFTDFLAAPDCDYYVQRVDGKLVGCGGMYVKRDTRTAGLCWGMVARGWHSKGLGRDLLLFRLIKLCEAGSAEVVQLDTSQHAQGFFERMGFMVYQVLPNGFGGGIDRVSMHLILTRDHCRALQRIWRSERY